MATVNYTNIINLATQGFRNIQNNLNALYNDSNLIVSVEDKGNNTYDTHGITPTTMKDLIANLALIKTSNSSNSDVGSVTYSGSTYIKGRIAYKGSNLTAAATDATFDSSTLVVSYNSTIPQGYYPGTTSISGSYTIDQGGVTLSGGGVSAANLSSSGEVASAFKPTTVVTKTNANADTENYSYAKISRASITRSITEGYITADDVGTLSSSTRYVKIPNAVFSATGAEVTLTQGTTQEEYNSSGSRIDSSATVITTSTIASGIPYYKIIITPSIDSTTTTGNVSVSTAGYARSTCSVDITVTGSGGGKNYYIAKSTLATENKGVHSATETLDYNKTKVISAGYYPNDRYIANNIAAGAMTISNDLQRTATTVTPSGGTAQSLDTDILKTSTSGLGKYYTIKYTATADKRIDTNGYFSGSVGTFTTTNAVKNNSVYLPAGSIITKPTINSHGSISVYQNYVDGSLVKLKQTADSGIVVHTSGFDASTLGTLGTNYWVVEGTGASNSGTVTSGTSAFTPGYITSADVSNNGNTSITPSVNTDYNNGNTSNNRYNKFYVKKATASAAISNGGNISTGAPTISLNAASNGTNSVNVNSSAATTSKPTTGYFVAVQAAATNNTRTLTPTLSVTTGGYMPKTDTAQSFTTNNVTITASSSASSITYIPITTGVHHNGYMTVAGWVPKNDQVYTTTYDSTEQCVDFIFNN